MNIGSDGGMTAEASGESVTMKAMGLRRWTPARIFLAVGGLWLVVVGAVGFSLDANFPIGAAEAEATHSAHIFGVFETNGWHNLAALLIAAVALPIAFGRPSWSRATAMAIGIGHVIVTAALFIWEPSTFWIASNDADQVIHATFAVGGIVSALATPQGAPPQSIQK